MILYTNIICHVVLFVWIVETYGVEMIVEPAHEKLKVPSAGPNYWYGNLKNWPHIRWWQGRCVFSHMELSTLPVQWNYKVRCCLLNGTMLGVILVSPPHIWERKTGQGGEEKTVTPKIVSFSVSVLAVVANKVEIAIWKFEKVTPSHLRWWQCRCVFSYISFASRY